MEMGDFAAHDSAVNESGTIFVASHQLLHGREDDAGERVKNDRTKVVGAEVATGGTIL